MKNFSFITTIFISLLLVLSSCDHRIAKIFPKRPNLTMEYGDASPDYKKGFDDGCESGMSGGSNSFYKMFYRTNAADGYKMASSPDYKSAWGVGWWYCYRYDYIKHKSGLYGSFFRGHY